MLSESQMIPFSVIPGDIGGQMGLFIGASILSILEIFDYIYEVRKKNPDGFDAHCADNHSDCWFLSF